MRYIQSLREREPDSPDHSEHGYLLVRMSTLYDMLSGNSYSMFIDEENSDLYDLIISKKNVFNIFDFIFIAYLS